MSLASEIPIRPPETYSTPNPVIYNQSHLTKGHDLGAEAAPHAQRVNIVMLDLNGGANASKRRISSFITAKP
ncbi:hypothetical protein EG329_001487 [Mollisiaceae sp. DMI_Dod_QoI]|nr:hypothetical protein EG329_001487 [Helotiales sp. DMI_Dod_QoI]